MGFTKLDSGIVHSSIWSEAYWTRVLWVTMLAMCDSNGFVAASRPGLIRAANITEAEFDSGISILESPDPDSRSSDHDGRRVEKVEGGWLVLNHARYRAFTPKEGDPNSPGAVRIRRWRERHKIVTNSPVVTPSNDTGVTSASVSASSSEDKRKGVDASFDAWWSRYPRKVEKKVASKAYLQAVKNGASPDDLAKALEGYRAEIDRLRTEERYIKHASTFLHEDRWRDYLPKPKPTAEEFRRQHEADLKKVRG